MGTRIVTPASTDASAVVRRLYREDMQVHRYRVYLLATGVLVTPVCEEDQLYPHRHEPELISKAAPVGDAITRLHACPACDRWDRQQRNVSTVVAGVLS